MTIKEVIRTFEGNVPVKVWTDDIEASARKQLENLSTLPFIHKHVAVMPDVHWGVGSTVGSVIPTIKAIIPAAVGVDIGCGMIAHKLPIRADQLPDNLGPMRSAIEAAVPHGRTDNGGPNDRGAFRNSPYEEVWHDLWDDARMTFLTNTHKNIIQPNQNQGLRQLGTLGGGNHFIELCIDKEDGVWLMLHSGSRGIGNRIGSHFIEQAKLGMDIWSIKLADPNLAYIPEASPLFDPYWKALSWAQQYAATNRELMMGAAQSAVWAQMEGLYYIPDDLTTLTAVNCHHNYVALEHHYGKNVYVTRKGAVRARKGDLGIIPGSMGARSFIVRGLGNEESFCSCSHGAGRKMSRGEANRTFTVEDLKAQTAGIECRKDKDVVDEIPGAYKDIDVVMANQSDLVEVVAELRQVLCVKG